MNQTFKLKSGKTLKIHPDCDTKLNTDGRWLTDDELTEVYDIETKLIEDKMDRRRRRTNRL